MGFDEMEKNARGRWEPDDRGSDYAPDSSMDTSARVYAGEDSEMAGSICVF